MGGVTDDRVTCEVCCLLSAGVQLPTVFYL